MNSTGHKLLIIGGTLSFLIAGLHVLIILIGIPAYRIFGGLGAELAAMLESGSLIPTLVVLLITLVFISFGMYAYSGAGKIRRLPLLRPGLITIGSIYLLRGLINIPYYWLTLREAASRLLDRGLIFDAIALTIGLLYLGGVILNWQSLQNGAEADPTVVEVK